MKRLLHGAGRQPIQGIGNSGQFVDHLVGHGGTLQDYRSSAPELQDAPSRRGNKNEHHGQKLLLPRNV